MPKAHIEGLVGPESQDVRELKTLPEAVRLADIVVHPRRDSTNFETGSFRKMLALGCFDPPRCPASARVFGPGRK